jgi:myo-inositol-1(or 4)-monophosphatase
MSYLLDSEELRIAEMAATTAGKAIHRRTQPLNQEWKGRINPVTAADLESEAIIISLIRDHFPNDIIISEESNPLPEHRVKGNRRWYIDPLDGTVNYSRNISHWCVSIAFVDETDRTQAAVVYSPPSHELFSAVRGQGAALNRERIHVSQTSQLDRAVIASGFPYSFDDPDRTNLPQWSAITPQVLTVRCMGAAAKDLCEVARGTIDAFWEIELERWDITAGALICSEAGAKVTSIKGEIIQGPSTTILTSSPCLHDSLLNYLGM